MPTGPQWITFFPIFSSTFLASSNFVPPTINVNRASLAATTPTAATRNVNKQSDQWTEQCTTIDAEELKLMSTEDTVRWCYRENEKFHFVWRGRKGSD